MDLKIRPVQTQSLQRHHYLPSATIASLALVYVLRRGNSSRWLMIFQNWI
jgi:hypothetical protein